ncbi:MAG: MlaD family protein [Bacteroidetes bacterium]|nr:MlaD family protein [Bacteroidota bacterium]
MTKDFKVGLTVFLSLVVLFAGLIWLKGWSFSQKHKVVVAKFDDTIGLLEGDPVFVRGTNVGKVELISNEGDFVSVKIILDEEIVLFTDAVAKIGMLEILAGKKIDVLPGISGVQLPDGGVITGILGADIPRMLSQVNDVSDDLKMLIRNLNITLDGLNKVIANQQFQNNTLTLFENLAQTSQNLAHLTSNLDKNSSKLDSMANRINRLVLSMNSAITELTPKAGTMLTSTSETMVQLNKTIAQFNDLATKLNNNKSLANQMLTDEKFAARFNSTIDSLNLFMNHIRTKPVKLDIDLW